MKNLNIRKNLCGPTLTVLISIGMSSCDSWVYDDLEPCTVTYRIKFNYEYNMKFADAFPSEVRAINVWAFNSNGRLAWKGEAEGDTLKHKDFSLDIDLAPGTYSFIAWGGLNDKESFSVEKAHAPASISDLGCKLNLLQATGEEALYSDHEMLGLYHGILHDVTLTAKDTEHVTQDIVMPMMKATNRVAVMLQHINNEPIYNGDFSVSIEADNSFLTWDYEVTNEHRFTYIPWAESYGQTTRPPLGSTPYSDGTQTSVSTHLSELSVSRIMADSDYRLKVVRNTDGQKIIDIPFVQYLLLVKGNYNRRLSDQEYLDRQDDYSMVFFISNDNTWYSSIGIYINNWVVVPPQESEI